MRFSPSDLRALTVFRALVEHGGFLGTQLALGMSQSTVSFHLRALEERLGFDLCQRGRKGFVLTERGQAVYDGSKTLVASISAFEGALGEPQARAAAGQIEKIDMMVTSFGFFIGSARGGMASPT